jgi:hypothetical protein
VPDERGEGSLERRRTAHTQRLYGRLVEADQLVPVVDDQHHVVGLAEHRALTESPDRRGRLEHVLS